MGRRKRGQYRRKARQRREQERGQGYNPVRDMPKDVRLAVFNSLDLDDVPDGAWLGMLNEFGLDPEDL